MTVLSHPAAPDAPHALIFDSGVGGLSVTAEIRKAVPDLRLSYLADDAFRPYGDKTTDQLKARLPDLLIPVCDMLKPDLLVIACNTASTTALPTIRAAVSIPVVGVVPAIKPAAEQSLSRSIAVLGTPGTVRRAYVDDLIEAYAADCDVRLCGSVALVEQAERKLSGQTVDKNVLRAEIAPLFAGDIGETVDAIVLACTHFPLLRDDLAALAPQTVAWIDSGEAVARRVATLLKRIDQPKGYALQEDTAFLTGPDDNAARREAFASYGFARVVSL